MYGHKSQGLRLTWGLCVSVFVWRGCWSLWVQQSRWVAPMISALPRPTFHSPCCFVWLVMSREGEECPPHWDPFVPAQSSIHPASALMGTPFLLLPPQPTFPSAAGSFYFSLPSPWPMQVEEDVGDFDFLTSLYCSCLSPCWESCSPVLPIVSVPGGEN